MEHSGPRTPTVEKIIEVCKEAGSWPNLWPKIEDHQRCLITARDLARLRNEYETEADPLALLEAVSLSYRESFSMPAWAHGALAEASQEYLFGHGEIDLDELIKLKLKRKGPANTAFKRRIKQWQYREAAFDVWLLHKGLGFTLPVSYLLASKLSHSYADKGKEVSAHYSPGHIEDVYKSTTADFKSLSPNDEWWGDDPSDHLDWYVEHYEDAFQSLVKNGEFWQKGLLRSAEKARKKLFDNAIRRMEPIPK